MSKPILILRLQDELEIEINLLSIGRCAKKNWR